MKQGGSEWECEVNGVGRRKVGIAQAKAATCEKEWRMTGSIDDSHQLIPDSSHVAESKRMEGNLW